MVKRCVHEPGNQGIFIQLRSTEDEKACESEVFLELLFQCNVMKSTYMMSKIRRIQALRTQAHSC